jgi:phosphoglycolate phosphatase
MNKDKFKIIVFDFDGVIEENYELHYQLSKIKTKNITRKEHKKQFESNIHINRAKFGQRNTKFNFLLYFNKLKEYLIIDNTKKEILIKLSKKYKLGIITSGLEKYIVKYLKNNNLLNTFDFIYGFETDKYKAIKFNLIMTKYNCKPSEIIFVTDTLGDILDAKNKNIKSIAVNFGYHKTSRLKKGAPYNIISSFKELYNIFG